MRTLEQEDHIEDSLIEAPPGYALRLLLRLGSVQEQAVNLTFDAQAGVRPAMAHWTIALGGLALFPLRGEQGALLVQDRRVFRVVQDSCADTWPWRDSSQSGWRVLRPPTSALLDLPLPCEIAGVGFASGNRVDPDEHIILRALTRARSDGSWRLEWPPLDRAGYASATVVPPNGADIGPASPAVA